MAALTRTRSGRLARLLWPALGGLALSLAGCGGGDGSGDGAVPGDGGGGALDAGAPDGGEGLDGGSPPDGGGTPSDAGPEDAGRLDAGPGPRDAGPEDAGPPDAGGPPPATFVSYLGSRSAVERIGDMVRDVAVDAAGNVYLTGGLDRYSGPLFETRIGGSSRDGEDIFVLKVDPSGALIYSTLIGGPGYDRAYGIEVDATGAAYVAGRAAAGFPTTSGAFQPTFAGDSRPNAEYGAQDGVVLKLSADGSRLEWATYLGGPDRGFIRDIAIDPAGASYLAFTAERGALPWITPGSFGTVPPSGENAILAKLSPDGARVVYAGYLSGSGDDGYTPTVRVNAAGEAFVVSTTAATDAPTTAGALQRTNAGGVDFLVQRVSADGSRFIYSTYLGGSGNESTETHHLALTASDEVVVAATTHSRDAPVTAGAYQGRFGGTADGYLARLSSDGSRLVAGTYLGGGAFDGCQGVAIGRGGEVAVTGATRSRGAFPTTSDAYQGAFGGGQDGYVVVLSADLATLRYGTYLGGGRNDATRAVAVFGGTRLVGGGATASRDLPTTSGALQGAYAGGRTDGFFFQLAR